MHRINYYLACAKSWKAVQTGWQNAAKEHQALHNPSPERLQHYADKAAAAGSMVKHFETIAAYGNAPVCYQ